MKYSQVDIALMLGRLGRCSETKDRYKYNLLIIKAEGFSETTHRSSILSGISVTTNSQANQMLTSGLMIFMHKDPCHIQDIDLELWGAKRHRIV